MSLVGLRAERAGLGARARRRLRDERGISLVEALVAIVISGIVLTALANTTIASLVAINENEQRTRGNALANEVVEHLQGLPWEDAGFYDDDYTAAPPSHVSLGATRPASEEPAAGEACESNVPPLPDCDGVMRDGVAYDVDTQVVWVDDPADNHPVSGDHNNPHDYKHFTVTAQWQARGQAASVTVEAYRAPNAVERPVSAFDLTLDEVTPSDQVVSLTDPEPTDPVACPLQCRNNEPVTFRATTSAPSASVTLGWTARDGTSQIRYMTSSAGGTEWTHTITQGSEAFANGETLFTLTATSSAGDEKKRYTRILFLHGLQVLAPTLSQSPLPISVKINGRLCNPMTLEVEVQGALTSDSVTASWSNGPGSTALSPVTATKRGATFRKVFPTSTTFTAGITTLTLTATRSSDPDTGTRTEAYTVAPAC